MFKYSLSHYLASLWRWPGVGDLFLFNLGGKGLLPNMSVSFARRISGTWYSVQYTAVV